MCIPIYSFQSPITLLTIMPFSLVSVFGFVLWPPKFNWVTWVGMRVDLSNGARTIHQWLPHWKQWLFLSHSHQLPRASPGRPTPVSPSLSMTEGWQAQSCVGTHSTVSPWEQWSHTAQKIDALFFHLLFCDAHWALEGVIGLFHWGTGTHSHLFLAPSPAITLL